MNFQWQFNGADIPDGTNDSLAIEHAQASDAGDYRVIVSNGQGSVTSDNATLTVLPAPPIIASFTPTSGPIGESVTISGANFGATPADNIVYFGAVRAIVTAAAVDSLTVTVPLGATPAPFSVEVNGLTGLSGAPFIVTFPSTHTLDQDSFAARENLAAGDGPIIVVVADLDGDGKPDLAVANNYNSILSVFRNVSASGTLDSTSFAPRVDFPAAAGVYALLAVDLDGDGKLDLAAANTGAGSLSVWRNLSTPGSFTTDSLGARTDFASGRTSVGVAAGDLDGDGKIDLAVANYDGGTVSIFRNISSPGVLDASSFAPKSDLITGGNPHDVAIQDLNGDGKPELLAMIRYSGVSVYQNHATPGRLSASSFGAPVSLPCNGITLAVGDLDGDGKPEIVAGSWDNQILSLFRNLHSSGDLAAASFAPRVDLSAGGNVHTVRIGDLDGDGKPDLALCTELPSHASVIQNLSNPGTLSTGSFGPRADFASGWNAVGIAIGDLDGDGKPDFALSNAYDDNVSLYRNLLSLPTPPEIVTQPQGQTVPFGTDVTLSVGVTGSSPLHYQWQRNGEDLAGANGATLTFPNAQPNQSGEYAVIVNNAFGSATSLVATLTITVDRSVTLGSADPRLEGSYVTLPVTLSSTGDVGGMTFVVRFNPDYLRDAVLTWSPAIDGAFSFVNTGTPGELRATFALPATAIPAGTQEIAAVKFLLRSVPESLDTPVDLQITDVSDADGNQITRGTFSSGATLRILRRHLIGDNNANDRLDVGDATVMLRYLAQLDPLRAWDTAANDVNQDQSLTSADVIKVLRAAAGIDPQPGGPAPQAVAVASGPQLSAGTPVAGEITVLTPDHFNGSAGQFVTVQVRLQNITTPVSAAAFTLNYAPAALRLRNAQSYHTGSLVPGNALAVWNVAPAQNNFVTQNGHLALAVSSANPWPNNNGILAEVTFEVQASAASGSIWPVTLSGGEITSNGFDTRSLPGATTLFIGHAPAQGALWAAGLNAAGQFEFSVIGEPGKSYDVDASTDLTHWTLLRSVTSSTGFAPFSDPAAGQLDHRFYRVHPTQ